MEDNKNLEIDNEKTFETGVTFIGIDYSGFNTDENNFDKLEYIKSDILDASKITSCTFNSNGLTFNGGVYYRPLKVKLRGFEIVDDKHRKYPDTEIELPVRADSKSAGYDFRTPVTVTINSMEQVLIWTDVKAYMNPNEVLQLYVRSSLGVKKGLILANTVGIIDSSYYGNSDNDGNIGICLVNRGDKPVTLLAGERLCQGIFTYYLLADEDSVLKETRDGGFGSSNNI